ncbi:hypothetical protein HKX48_003987 [Thoreauomyces humboldtii]|nr:hypothetical protein HKX48_003987 [Thoreauomyces humboldtii]
MKQVAAGKRTRAGPAAKKATKAVGGAVNKPKTGLRGKRRPVLPPTPAPEPEKEEEEASDADEGDSQGDSDADSASAKPVGRNGKEKKIYKPSGKKGKKFPDHSLTLDLIDAVNTKEEGRVGKKVERNQRLQKLTAEATVKKQKKQNTKRAELELVKRQLREEALLKKKRKKPQVPEEGEDSSKKKVSFSV